MELRCVPPGPEASTRPRRLDGTLVAMHADRRLLGWGVFFLLLGAIPLAVQAGLIPRETVGQAWRLWPLILIGGGIGIILQGTRAAALGGVIVAVTFGVIGGSLLAGGGLDVGSVACGGATPSGPAFQNGGTFAGPASVDIEMRCGDLTVRSVDGSGWSVSGVADPDEAPDVSASASSLSLRSRSQGLFIPGITAARARWDVSLPRASKIDLEATVNAGEATLDLRGGALGSIDLTSNAGSLALDLDGATASDIGLTVNAGDTRIVLPATSLQGSLTVNAGSIRICSTPGVGLRFRTNDNLTASFDFPGLTRDGSTWTSPDYATSAAKIDLSTTANAGSIALNPSSGCR